VREGLWGAESSYRTCSELWKGKRGEAYEPESKKGERGTGTKYALQRVKGKRGTRYNPLLYQPTCRHYVSEKAAGGELCNGIFDGDRVLSLSWGGEKALRTSKATPTTDFKGEKVGTNGRGVTSACPGSISI